MKYIIAATFSLFALTVIAQDVPKPAVQPATASTATQNNFAAGFDGMLAVSYGSNVLGINVGGPSLKYKFTKDFKLGAGAFPSLIFLGGQALPRLAVSPIMEYKKWMLITPYYGFDKHNNAIWTFGIGYKLI